MNIIYVLLAIWAVCITAAALWMLNVLILEASHAESLIKPEKIEANAEKSEKKRPEIRQQSNRRIKLLIVKLKPWLICLSACQLFGIGYLFCQES